MAVRAEQLSHHLRNPDLVDHMRVVTTWTSLIGEPARLSTELQTAVDHVKMGRLKERFKLGIDASIKHAKWNVENVLLNWARNMIDNNKISPFNKTDNAFCLELCNKLEGKSPDTIIQEFKLKKLDWGIADPVYKWTIVEIPSLLKNDDSWYGRVGDVFPYEENPANKEQMKLNTQLQTAIGKTLGILDQDETWSDFIHRSTTVQDRHSEISVEVIQGKLAVGYKADYSNRDKYGVVGLKRLSFKSNPDLFIVNNLKFINTEAIVGFSVPKDMENDFSVLEALDENMTSPMIRLVVPTRSFFQTSEVKELAG